MKTNIAILHRVVQDWRAPVFERIANKYGYENVVVYHGPDFHGTKVISTNKPYKFQKILCTSIKLKFRGGYGIGCMPISPFLLIALRKAKTDIVITEGASNLFNAIIGYIYCKIYNKKYIWWSLGTLINVKKSIKGKIMGPLVRYLERKADGIITYSSQGEAYYLNNGINKNKIYKAINVVDTDERINYIRTIEKEEYKSDEKTNLLYVGWLAKSKKLEVLLEAVAVIIKRGYLNIHLDVVGEGPDYEYYCNMAEEYKINKHVKYHGKVIDGVSKIFIKNDILIMPGLGGLVISDAMVHGLAVIAGNGDGCEKDLVKDGENGFYIEPMTAEMLADKIIYLIKNRDEMIKYKIRSRQIIETMYNINTFMDQIYKAIDG